MTFPQRVLAPLLFLAAAGSVANAQQTPAKPVQVMIVGVFHLANPGHDLHDLHVDDVLQPARQQQIASTVEALARFHPSVVMVEWPEPIVAERYKSYLAGTLAPSRNEVVQLGFRLAKLSQAKGVYGIDADGEFPYQAVQKYASAHGQSALLAAEGQKIDQSLAEIQTTLQSKGIGPALHLMNEPDRLLADQGFYRDMLKVGSGTEQPGADLVAAWYKRNLLICANLVQTATPGDRITVFYGAGHAFLLRQCVAETPGFELVNADDYLPE